LDIVLILMQDWCMVCIERTVGSDIVLDAPIELQGDKGHVESHFFSFEDRISVSAR
jgi:hypothetical protein